MKTYWLLDPSKKHQNSTRRNEIEVDNGKIRVVPAVVRTTSGDIDENENHVFTAKIQRLVDWNVDLLQRNLKAIIGRRNATAKTTHATHAQRMHNMNGVMQMERTVGKSGDGKIVLDEVTEIVTLPQFDARIARNQACPTKVRVSDEVKDQLRDYVECVASMYNPNAFHNFEHASHVTMSVSKLLSRIVAPDIDSNTGNVDSTLHDHTYGITSDPLTQFAVILSALIHDVDHVGIPNNLLLIENMALAEKYKGKSMAEQNSIDLAWDLLMQKKFSALRSALYGDSESDFKRFRQLMVNTVLATDIADKDLKNLRNMRWDKAFSDDHCEPIRDHVNRKATIVIEHLIQVRHIWIRS